MSDSIKADVIRWFDEIWNQGRMETINELLAADSVIHDGETSARGPEEFRAFYHRLRSAFNEIHITTEAVICEGDLASVRWSATMRHSGPGLGVAATGKQIHTTGMGFIRYRDGKFVEAWQNWDMMGTMQQIQQPAIAPIYMGSEAKAQAKALSLGNG